MPFILSVPDINPYVIKGCCLLSTCNFAIKNLTILRYSTKNKILFKNRDISWKIYLFFSSSYPVTSQLTSWQEIWIGNKTYIFLKKRGIITKWRYNSSNKDSHGMFLYRHNVPSTYTGLSRNNTVLLFFFFNISWI